MSNLENQGYNRSASESPESVLDQGFSPSDLDDIYQQTKQLLRQSLNTSRSTLIDAPPGCGKTTCIFQVINETDAHFTYLTKREDLYKQAEELSEDFGVTATIIPSPHRVCPSFNQDSSHYEPEADSLYKRGIRAGPLHDLLNLACAPDCPYLQFWEGFDADDQDVLVGHYKHAYISSVIEDRFVILDEFPGTAFEQEFEEAPRMIGRFLNNTDGMPFDDWDDLIVHDYSQWKVACEWFAENGVEVDTRTLVETDETTRYHSITPFLVWAVLEAQKGDNGFGVPWFNHEPSDTISAAFGDLDNNRRVAIDHERREIQLLTQPYLRDAKKVIGLDGTPFPKQWELATGEDYDQLVLFDQSDDLNTYIHDILGITIKRCSDHLKPYHSGHITPNRDEAILFGVEIAEGQKPALIAPKKALDKYRDTGILDRAKRSMNYAQVLSSNTFKGESVGVIHGSPHPGDATLKKWAAYFGHHIEGEGRGMNKTYGDFGDEIYQHFVHNQVLQAILRFGRGESEATVYVNTAAIPDWLDIDATVTVEYFNTENKRIIADYLRDVEAEGATKSNLTDVTGISKTTIEDVLYEFRDHDLIEEEQSDWPYTKIFRWSP